MNPYHILEINKDSSTYDIKNAYKKLALKYHPDKNKNNKEECEIKFKEISEAYQILSDEKKKELYDLTGSINTPNFELTPEELFDNIFQNVDPKVKQFLKTTYDNINNAINNSECKNLSNIYENIDKSQLINNGAELIKDIFIEKLKENKTNVTINNEYLIIDINKITKLNKIVIPIDFYFKNRHYKLQFIDKEKNLSSNVELDTEYLSHDLNIDNIKYNFLLIDDKDKIYKRTNSYDLCCNLDIGIDDYFSGFQLILIHFKKDINFSINISNNTNIIKLPGYGFPIHSKNTFGDLYISFKIIKNINRLHPLPETSYFKKSETIYSLIDTINLYE